MLLKRPIVDFDCDSDGFIRFTLPLNASAMSPEAMKHARLLRTRWFADAVGGFLVHSNFDRLNDIICRNDYAKLAAQQFHTGFGLVIHPGCLEFTCCCQVLNQLWNERLRWELKEVAT
jgi:hypothetical protein